ncbi:MAG: hypothetical protein WBZ05_06820 [Desulfobacterales bacterium]|jgi:hypothetical protein
MSPSGSFVNKKMFENKCQHLEINWQSLNNIRRVIKGLDQIITVDAPAFGKYYIACHKKVSDYKRRCHEV